MSRIEYVKSRLGEMFLRDRGNVDEQTAELIKNDVRLALEKFFILKDFKAEFGSLSDGEVSITVKASGRRLR